MKNKFFKTFVGISFFLFFFYTLQAQTVSLTFTGRDAVNHYVQLNRVSIINLTKGWQEIIAWPDTTLLMQNGTSIAESIANEDFGLSQNYPNPFNGTTNVNLVVADVGEVTLEITDVYGRIVRTQNIVYPQVGKHQFRITLSTDGMYVMTAQQNGKKSSIKMVNNGCGNGDQIDYLGIIETPYYNLTTILKSHTRGITENSFTFGDQMEYVGYATINGEEVESQCIVQTQDSSQIFVLQFEMIQEFDALPCLGTPTVTDAEGNVYNTVQIGNQCWMKENLRTTKYADSTSIAQGNNSLTSTSIPYWYYPDNDTNNVTIYGLLYNWKAVMRFSPSSSANPSGVQGICPNGWHVPSRAEWTQLIDYMNCQSQYGCGSGHNTDIYDNPYFAKALADTIGWDYSNTHCAVGNDLSVNNATGFSALPASTWHSNYVGQQGHLTSSGRSAVYWSSTATDANMHFSSYFWIYYDYGYVQLQSGNYNNGNDHIGQSVRCLRNEAATLPTVITAEVSNINDTSAIGGGNVFYDGGTPVTAKGVCYSTSHNPTITDFHTTEGNGTGMFISNLTGLSVGTTYYVRAYAVNSLGRVYGNEVSFTTPNHDDGQPCPEIAIVIDIDSNVYNTVLIGEQCWMKENLRVTRYADTTTISQGDSHGSYGIPYWYYPNNDSSIVPTYGLLYNWSAVMHGANSSSTNPSGVQGICPNGWHVPSDAEWTQLSNYVSSRISQFVCGSDNNYIAKALADSTDWSNSGNLCAVGYNQGDNNATGFSALPAGIYGYINYSTAGTIAFSTTARYWSTTTSSSSYVRYFSLNYNDANVTRNSNSNDCGYSVRCIHD